jgi:hypothetical protein
VGVKDAITRAASALTGGDQAEERRRLAADEEARRAEHAAALAAHKAERETAVAHLIEHHRLEERDAAMRRAFERLVQDDQRHRGAFEAEMERLADPKLTAFLGDVARELDTLRQAGSPGGGPLADSEHRRRQARVEALMAVQREARGLLLEAVDGDQLAGEIERLREDLDRRTAERLAERERRADQAHRQGEAKRRGFV